MIVVPLYAALLAIVFVTLSVRTIRMRRRTRVAVGDGGNEAMLRAMRAHGNFAEYVPFALLLLAFAEVANAAQWLLHALCGTLLVGRCVHAWGVSQVKENFRFRVFGMAMTFAVITIAALYVLTAHLRSALPEFW
jgi:hypothetical protein